ncbi:NAD-dependent epimerase/dehydratase family protein [Haloechinothrix salitolerans]|uniref:NAD-dependent epimerase/dehydratase family protein n=1 Tax=Haloechinothrix salitolerans TaxID=926830 RepID=A0ABW2C742_9PSEU
MVDKPRAVLVTGAGGFIGGHLVKRLLEQGEYVRAVDVKPAHKWDQRFSEAENITLDLKLLPQCRIAAAGMDVVYHLAADMGGIGFIENHKAECMLSVLISTHMLQAARDSGVSRFFYSSSACVYAANKQDRPDADYLVESDAYPAMPEDGYGWEKLFSERMARHFAEDYGMYTRVARYHNVYGPHGAWQGGREKAPAAICRKVATAKLTGDHSIEIWGDGKQTRSFTYVDDCVTGSMMIAEGDYAEPLNLGSSELVTINELVDVVEDIAGIRLHRRYKLDAPQGVRGRCSDNTLIESVYGWQPSISLREGLTETYTWIEQQVAKQLALAPAS